MLSEERRKPVRLGLMPPLSGLVNIYGAEISAAATIACAEINEAGGILGRPLELVIEDDGSLPATAVPAALRLVREHGCAALVGNLLSNSRIAVASQVAEPLRVPYLNFSFYEGSISGRHFFHFAALPNQQIDRMIPFMARRYGLKMYFAGNNYEWPRGSIDAAKRSLFALGGDVVGEEYLPIGTDRGEIDALLERLARSGADVFVPYFAGTDQILLLTRFTQLGLKARMAVVMGHYDEVMASRLPPEVREGFYSSNSYFMSVATAENRAYLDRLARLPGINGLWPQGDGFLTNFGEGTYLCVHAFAQAANSAASLAAADLVPALERVRVRGPQGMVTMDAASHHAHVNTFLARCKADGAFDIVESFGCNRPVIPERYRATETLAPPATPLSPEQAAGMAADVGTVVRRITAARQILAIADVAVIATDAEGLIIEANPNACALFGYGPQELPGLSVQELVPPQFRHAHAADIHRFVEGDVAERPMRERGTLTGYRKDGSFFPVEVSIAKVRVGEGWMLVATLRDISDRRQAEEQLVWRATHDVLTGLANRALIRERLDHALQRTKRHGQSLALLFVDLDGFKAVNDSHGHDAGDALLKTVAERLIAQVRPGDTVARLAGDEFVVLCEQLEHPAAIAGLAERINDSLRQPVVHRELRFFVTASIGVAIGHGATHSADEVLRNADTAMYAVKAKGRDGWQFFSESLEEEARQRRTITQGLRLALEREELAVRFQPIVATASGQVVGGELLLRWHPAAGEVSPGLFIPIAEMTGAIVPIGAWVFRQACRAEAAWRARFGAAAPYVSVNVSTRQLDDPTLVDDFAAALAEAGAEPARIVMEITETSLMSDVEANLHVLRRLAGLGLKVAVDDFGTGYSSLAQLLRLPVSLLKIDREFVDGLDKRADSRTITAAVVGMGRTLGLDLVAEGVENATQLAELTAYGCHYAQGYFFHRPLVEARFLEVVAAAVAGGGRARAVASL